MSVSSRHRNRWLIHANCQLLAAVELLNWSCLCVFDSNSQSHAPFSLNFSTGQQHFCKSQLSFPQVSQSGMSREKKKSLWTFRVRMSYCDLVYSWRYKQTLWAAIFSLWRSHIFETRFSLISCRCSTRSVAPSGNETHSQTGECFGRTVQNVLNLFWSSRQSWLLN